MEIAPSFCKCFFTLLSVSLLNSQTSWTVSGSSFANDGWGSAETTLDPFNNVGGLTTQWEFAVQNDVSDRIPESH